MKLPVVCVIVWILGPIITVEARNRLGFRVIMPKTTQFKGSIYLNLAKRALGRGLFGYDVQLIELHSNSPEEIFKMFCEDVLPNNVTSILYMHVKDGLIPRRASEYVMNVIQDIGVPLMAWDPGFEGALENQKAKRTVQLSVTIYHQAELMVKLLHNYNWTYFSIVTTAKVNHFDFVNAINELVQANNEYSGSIRKQRLTLISTIIIPHGVNTPDEITDYLAEHNHVDSRIYLLHASSQETKNIMDAATMLKLTGSEFLWIFSSTSVDKPLRGTPRSFPVGSFGVTHRGEYRTNEEIAEVQGAIKASTAIWLAAMKVLRSEGKSITDLTLDLACASNTSAGKWAMGDEIYNKILAGKSMEDTYSMEFSKRGINKLVKLNILNIQMTQDRGREYPAFKKIGEYYPKRKRTLRSQTVNMTLRMNDITWPGGKSVPPKGRPARRFFRIATLDEAPYVTYTAPNKLTGLCRSPAVPCRLVNDARFVKDDPANLASDGTRHWCCAGLSIDLLKVLSERMAFDYDLFEVPDRTSGVQNEYTGLWNGLIRILQDGNADMVMTALTITPKRSEYIDMSMPYLETGTTIVVSLRKGAISPTAVLEPYDYPSWCLILVFSVHSIGASIFIFEWLSPRGLDQGKTPMREHTFSLFRSFWLIWAMLFGASVSADNPRGVSSRFLANVWALFALVFLASYTANLAAFMITKEVYYDLSGIKDWRLTNPESHKPPFRFATVPNGSTEENLRQNHNRMFSYMKKYNQPSVKEAVKALKNGDIQAFIYDATPLEYQIGIDPSCHLISVGKWYAMTGYAVGLPKGSSALVEEINKIILDLQDIGELDRLRKFWLAGACHSKQKSGQSSHQLGILNFTSAFILLASGIVLGGLLLILEHLYFRFGRKCLKQYDTCGCCALVSLSMGKSLTFEQSVMEAIDFRKKYRCKDPLCETQLWKVKHQLDLALLRIDKLNKEIRKDKSAARQAIKGPSDQEDEEDGMTQKQQEAEEEERNSKQSDPPDGPEQSEIVNEDVNYVRHSDRSMRRSPSYNQAVSKDNEDNDDVTLNSNARKRYSDGKCYSSVGDGEV